VTSASKRRFDTDAQSRREHGLYAGEAWLRSPQARARVVGALLRSSPRQPLHERVSDAAATVESTVLAGLEGNFTILARKIVPLAIKGRFSVIIGEDNSGRVPAILLRDVINRRLRAAGLSPLCMVFWQAASPPRPSDAHGSEGERGRYATALHNRVAMRSALARREAFLSAAGASGSTALIVTDWIQSGGHLSEMAAQLGELGISCDVASLGVSRGYQPPTGIILHSGSYPEPKVNGLFQCQEISGLRHEKYTGKPVITEPGTRAAMASARRDARIIAARIARGLPGA